VNRTEKCPMCGGRLAFEIKGNIIRYSCKCGYKITECTGELKDAI